MKIVIEIPEQIYENAKNGLLCGSPILTEAIKNGTPLPKGHGRLIDADDVTDFEGHYITTDAPTIIEAESEDKE